MRRREERARIAAAKAERERLARDAREAAASAPTRTDKEIGGAFETTVKDKIVPRIRREYKIHLKRNPAIPAIRAVVLVVIGTDGKVSEVGFSNAESGGLNPENSHPAMFESFRQIIKSERFERMRNEGQFEFLIDLSPTE